MNYLKRFAIFESSKSEVFEIISEIDEIKFILEDENFAVSLIPYRLFNSNNVISNENRFNIDICISSMYSNIIVSGDKPDGSYRGLGTSDTATYANIYEKDFFIEFIDRVNEIGQKYGYHLLHHYRKSLKNGIFALRNFNSKNEKDEVFIDL